MTARSFYVITYLLIAAWTVAWHPLPAYGEPGDSDALSFANYAEDSNRQRRPHPDDWTRVVGDRNSDPWNADHPGYNEWSLDEKNARSNNALRVTMVEHNFAAETTAFLPVDRNHAYRLTGFVRGEGLERFAVSIAVLFYAEADETTLLLSHGEPVGFETKIRSGTFDWEPLTALEKRIPLQAHFAKIRCRVRGNGYSGTAWFDDIQLQANPRIEIYSEAENNLFVGDSAVVLKISATGIQNNEYQGRLRITNWLDETVWSQPDPVAIKSEGKTEILVPDPNRLGYGYLKAWLTLTREGNTTDLTYEFGRIRERGDRPLMGIGIDLTGANLMVDQFSLLSVLRAGTARVNLLKATRSAEDILTAASRILRAVEVVGLFGTPISPDTSEQPNARLSSNFHRFATQNNSRSKAWAEKITEVVQSSQDIADIWMLGPDDDSGFLGKSNLAAALSTARLLIGTDVRNARLVVPASIDQNSLMQPDGIHAIDYSVPPFYTPASMNTALRTIISSGKTWVTLQLPHESSRAELAAFAQKMVLAKVAGATRTFVKAQSILTTHQGSGNKYYYAYRSLARALGNARYLGEIRMSGGSVAHLFASGNSRSAVIWRDAASLATTSQDALQESVWWDQAIKAVDLMGNAVPIEQSGMMTTLLKVTDMPIIVTGISRELIDTQTSALLEGGVIEARRDYQVHRLSFVNQFDEAISGKVTLLFPQKYGTYLSKRHRQEFSLRPGERFLMTFETKPPVGETIGEKALTLRLEINGQVAESLVPYRLSPGIQLVTNLHSINAKQIELTVRVGNTVSTKPVSLFLYFRGPTGITQSYMLRSIPVGATVSRRFLIAKDDTQRGDQKAWVIVRERSGSRFANKVISFVDNSADE